MSEIPYVFHRRLKADPDLITADEARWMLGFYGLPGGERPGGFRMDLIKALTSADPENLLRLAFGFPGLVAAFESQEDVAGLQTIADSDLHPEPYRCPHCGAVSHHPTDKAYRYCGACHRFAGSDVVMVNDPDDPGPEPID